MNGERNWISKVVSYGFFSLQTTCLVERNISIKLFFVKQKIQVNCNINYIECVQKSLFHKQWNGEEFFERKLRTFCEITSVFTASCRATKSTTLFRLNRLSILGDKKSFCTDNFIFMKLFYVD